MRMMVVFTSLFVILILVVSLLLVYFFDFRLTGLNIYEQSSQSDFEEGTYNNVEYNGNGIVLVGENLSGNYTSKIFEGDSSSQWNEISWQGFQPDVKFLFAVDNAGDIYLSTDLGETWTQKTDNYSKTKNTADIFSDGVDLYIITKSKKELYKSIDKGVTWEVINEKVSDKSLLVIEKDSYNNFYISTKSGIVYKSTDSGITWIEQGDFNGGAKKDAKGIAIDSKDNIFIVDGSGSVYKSTNSGINWTEQTNDYGGKKSIDDMTIDKEGNLYILFDKKIYKSQNEGVNWSIINNNFTSYKSKGSEMLVVDDIFFIADDDGRIFKSTDFGISWIELGDFNLEARDKPKGLTSFTEPTSLIFQARNCSTSNCSDAEFTNVDVNNLNLDGKYFQYKVLFSSPDSSETPFLTSVTIDNLIVDDVAEPSAPVSSSGGGGGGESFSIRSISISPSEISEGIVKELRQNEKIEFEIKSIEGSESHSISLNSVSDDEVVITIQSDPIIVALKINESGKFDLSGDGFYDLYVKLENIINGKAKIKIQEINEKVASVEKIEKIEQVETEEISEENNNDISRITGAVIGFVKSTIGVSLIFIVGIVAIFTHLKIRKLKKKKSKKALILSDDRIVSHDDNNSYKGDFS